MTIEAPEALARLTTSNRRLVSSSSVTFASRAFAKSAQLVFLVAAAHLLTVEEFAAYSYVLVLAAAFTVLGDTGAPLVACRDIAAGRHPADRRFWDAAPVVLVAALAAAVAVWAFGAVDSGPGSSPLTMALASAFVLANRAFDLASLTLRALGRYKLEAALQAGGAAAFIAVGVAVAAGGAGVAAIVGVLLAKEAASAAVALAVLRRDVGRPRLRSIDWRPLLRAGILLSLAGIALAVVLRLPLAVLANTGTTHDTAVFSAAQRFADGAVLLATTAGLALLPGISLLAAAEPARVRSLLAKVGTAAVATATVAALVAVPLAGGLMTTVFGERYAGGAAALAILLVALPAYALLGVTWSALVALGAERDALRLAGVGLVVAVACAVVLVPKGGQSGAALAYAVPLVVMAGGSARAAARRVGAATVAPVPASLAGRP